MEGTWNHDRPYYRCQIPRDDASNNPDHPATVYVREDSIVPHLDSWVGELFTDEHLDDTCAKLAAAAQPDTDREAQERQTRDRIRKLDQELDSYRAIVRSEPEAASSVGKWIAETNQERRRLETLLGQTPTTRLTAEDVKALVASLRTSLQRWPQLTRRTRPRSTPRWESTSPTTKTAGSSSNPGRV